MNRNDRYREELNHLEDEEWDRNRAKRDRLKECGRDARLGNDVIQYAEEHGCVSYAQARREMKQKEKVCGSKSNPMSGIDQST